MKKKSLALTLASVLALALLSGCGGQSQQPESSQAQPPEIDSATASEPEQPAPLKTGMAVVSSMGGMDAGEENGMAQIDSLAVAVIVDGDGKIVDCSIDMSWNSIAFTPDGQIVRKEGLPSKRELGDDYGMAAASGIGKEWYEQADALEDYVIGKTADEITGIAVDEESRATDADLAASVTIRLADYKEAIVQAIENAKEAGAQEGDKLGLGIFTHMDFCADASAEMNGNCEADALFAAVTVDEDGKVTSAVIDANQGAVQIDTEGKILSELAPFQTKRQLGDAYGMKSASSIEKEWYEQADAIEEYITGKTAEEISGIAVDEDNRALDVPDLISEATVRFNVFQEAVVRAIQNAA